MTTTGPEQLDRVGFPASAAAPAPVTGSVADVAAEVHLGRRPVFDAGGAVVGYELLFRPSPASATAQGPTPEADQATADVILRTFADFGLETVVGSRTAFLELPRSFVVGRYPLPVPPEQLVLQLPRGLDADGSLLEGARRLRSRGFCLAVDASDSDDGHASLLEVADVVRLDLTRTDAAALDARASTLRRHGRRLLASGVTDEETLETCRRLGVTWFSGDLLSRPAVLSRRTLDSSSAACLRLLTALSPRHYDVSEVEAALRSDPGLSLRVLRAVNASTIGLRTLVRSVRQAVLLLGSRTLLGWVAVITLAGGTGADAAAVETALVRGRMCELLAPRLHVQGEAAFTVGLLHGLSPLLGVPLEMALAELPLHADVVAAAVEHTGALGAVLADVLAYEANEPAALLPAALLRETYVAALAWTSEVLAGSQSAA